jgi:NTP pyrophosphatase (non-canonical NTP hydrolase)
VTVAAMSEQTTDSLVQLREILRKFASDRDWEQFHSPKNLAIALSVEAGELLERFQWMPDHLSRTLSAEDRARAQDELADVLICLIRLADQLNVDLISAAFEKIARNTERYPMEKARGNYRKHTEL